MAVVAYRPGAGGRSILGACKQRKGPVTSELAEQASTPRSMRRDAMRNRTRLIKVAVEAFAESGVDASLNEIAKRAGVGSGTLYRHFPTREALLEAVVSEQFDSLTIFTRGLLEEPADGATLRTWLRAVITHVNNFPGLASVVMSTLDGGTSHLVDTCGGVRLVGADLLDRMKAAGTVSAEVDIVDLLKLVSAIAVATERAADALAEANGLLELVLRGVEAH